MRSCFFISLGSSAVIRREKEKESDEVRKERKGRRNTPRGGRTWPRALFERTSKHAPVNAQWSLTSYGQTKARRADLSREIAVEIIFTLAEQRCKTNSIVVIVPSTIIPSFHLKCIEIDTDCARKAHMWKGNILASCRSVAFLLFVRFQQFSVVQ